MWIVSLEPMVKMMLGETDMNKYQQWWNSLSPQMQEYLKRQPIWHDRDLYKAMAVGAVLGFAVGFLLGFEWAWRPVTTTVNYLVG